MRTVNLTLMCKSLTADGRVQLSFADRDSGDTYLNFVVTAEEASGFQLGDVHAVTVDGFRK